MKKFFAMLLCFGLVAAMGTGIVGCTKEKTAEEKKKEADDKAAKDKKDKDDKDKADKKTT